MKSDIGAQGAAAASDLGLAGWLLIAVRLSLLIPILLACVLLHYLTRIFTRRRVWPRIFFRSFCGVIGLRIRKIGKRHRKALFLPNHVSWIDIPALVASTGSAFIAHDGLSQIAPLRWFCGLNDTVFIARHRRSSIGEQVEQMRQALMEAGSLTVFLEGTTSDGTTLLPFKSALLSAISPLPEGISIQPVWLDFADVQRLAWVDDEPGLSNFLKILARLRPVALTIHFLEPLKDAELADRKAMSAAARHAIHAAMKAPAIRA